MRQNTPPVRVIALIVGDVSDEPTIEMACLLARHRRAELFFVAATQVDRSLPLDAPMDEASQSTHRSLERARQIAFHLGCSPETRELRTRDVATALVDEAADLGCDHIVLGTGESRGPASRVAEQVLRNAPCSVWLHHTRLKR